MHKYNNINQSNRPTEMQYPQIQFYKGSLVRLASGKLKQVEDLSSDDFLESARLARSSSTSLSSLATINGGNTHQPGTTYSQHQINSTYPHQQQPGSGNGSGKQQVIRQRPGSAAASASFTTMGGCSNHSGSNQRVDENNNSVFNSPEPTPSFDSPTMDLMETDDLMMMEEEVDYINDVDDDDDDEELDVVSCNQVPSPASTLLTSRQQKFSIQNNHNLINNNNIKQQTPAAATAATTIQNPDDDLYIDSSVVRDFLEVGPPSSASPPNSANIHYNHHHHNYNHHHSSHPDLTSQFSMGAGCGPSTSSSNSNSNSPGGNLSRPSGAISMQQINLTVLIKFFLESSRSIVFIEVPIEHPFFVLHRGWSSWNPQRTFDKFGLKCRKLKIGDTCISLIRSKRKEQPQIHHHHQHHQQQQQESDQCNILFSSIKINE